MAKSKNANKVMIKTLAIFLAVFGLAALSLAGLLSYYAQVVGTVNVEPAIYVTVYDKNGNEKYKGYVAGNDITTLEVNARAGSREKVGSATIRYDGNSVSAGVKLELSLTTCSSGCKDWKELFSEILAYELKVGTYTFVVNSNGVTYGSNTQQWNNNQVTIQIGSKGITLTKDDTNKKITVEGTALTLAPNQQVSVEAYLTWNPATVPGKYQLTLKVMPA